jgi:Uma2 family endonuclease
MMQQQDVLWGERVIGAPYPFTVADLATLPDDTWQYEIVEGELIRMPGSGYDAGKYAVRLLSALHVYSEAHNLGEVTGPDTTYDLTRPGDPTDTALGPDAAFVQTARLPGPTPGYAKLAPDLVAEFVSPSQYRPEMTKKAKLYIERGVRLVWIIWPGSKTANVWRQASPDAPTQTLTIVDSLDGFDVLLGFTYPLATLLR